MSDFLYGRHPVYRALCNPKRQFESVAIQKDLPQAEILDQIYQQAQKRRLPIKFMDKLELERKFSQSGKPHQGVVAVAGDFPYTELDDLLAKTDGKNVLFLILDHLQDPQNIGALIRTAELAGADGVIIPKDRACLVTPAVVKTAAGATELVPIALVTNINKAIDQLKEKWIQIVGLETGDNTTIYDVDFTGPTAIVIGSEGPGIAQLTQKRCDRLAEIPMPGKLESLNASVAGAVGMFEVVRQRFQKNKNKQ